MRREYWFERRLTIMDIIIALLELPRFIKEFYKQDWSGWCNVFGKVTLKQTLWLWWIIWIG